MFELKTNIAIFSIDGKICTVKLLYTGPSKNQLSLNIGRFLKPLLNISLQRKSLKTFHPSKLAIFFGPGAGQF
jgi:hypothetical protein